MDFIALIITKILRRMKRSPSQVQGLLCFLIVLMKYENKPLCNFLADCGVSIDIMRTTDNWLGNKELFGMHK